jgi:hypothetical protein
LAITHYDIFGISPDVNHDEIKAAYRRLSLNFFLDSHQVVAPPCNFYKKKERFKYFKVSLKYSLGIMKNYLKLIFLGILIILIAGGFFFNLLKGKNTILIDQTGKVISTRIKVPFQFERVWAKSNSFAEFLRNLPLKNQDAEVHLFDGSIKLNKNAYISVVDLKIGDKDLHQCADAVIRLRADYLKSIGEENRIRFHFTNGFLAEYQKWKEGYRIQVNSDNHVKWVKTAKPSSSYSTYWKFLEMVFSYAGTKSLSSELIPVDLENMKIGDVLIQGGLPGHAVIVVDLAINPRTGQKAFLLAQSYMPAQEIQILLNSQDYKISPWYLLEPNEGISTPEWSFDANSLKRFKD